MATDVTFYRDLPVYRLPLHELIGKSEYFVPIAESFHVIVVDVEGSTIAVGKGRHHDVNLAATGAIIAVLNRLREWKEEGTVAYFFGGDGATFLVPGNRCRELLQTLENYRHHVSRTQDLVLRVGSIPVREVASRGNLIRLAKCQLNDFLAVPVVLGNGLKTAEARIKAEFVATAEVSIKAVNLEGMQCRWDEIPPPRDEEQIICLIINNDDEKRQPEVYRRVLAKMEDIFGKLDQRQPISATRLRLSVALSTIRREMRLRLGRFNLRYLLQNSLMMLYGPRWLKNSAAGKEYLNKVSLLSDTIMIDGSINTVISGRKQQVEVLLSYLDKLEKRGDLIYGVHRTHASVISCYVLDHDTDHLHFIDATEGGYTSAAKVYKAKLKAKR
jgi:hypothetical protein